MDRTENCPVHVVQGVDKVHELCEVSELTKRERRAYDSN